MLTQSANSNYWIEENLSTINLKLTLLARKYFKGSVDFYVNFATKTVFLKGQRTFETIGRPKIRQKRWFVYLFDFDEIETISIYNHINYATHNAVWNEYFKTRKSHY